MTEPTRDLREPHRDVLAGLTEFQRNTVEHIVDRFYRTGDGGRFLVADETGLGKTLVARGVIARAIEELQHADSVQRIDVIYVCSNLDLARQNLAKLNVTGEAHHAVSSGLTLLAKHARRWQNGSGAGRKPVNLISFTPGTSFDQGDAGGTAEERALLFLLLEDSLELRGHRRSVAWHLLQGFLSSHEKLGWHVEALRREIGDDLDREVQGAFLRAAGRADEEGASPLDRFATLLESGWRAAGRNGEWREASWRLVGRLRRILARESVHLLEPDLVIMDEFQRFRHLLDPHTPAGALAHHLYDYGIVPDGDRHSSRPIAKTLLLSATPYKPFTFAEEGEDHHTDFLRVIEWLSDRDSSAVDRVRDLFAAYRAAVVDGLPVGDVSAGLRSELLRVMARTERPRSAVDIMTQERALRVDDVSPQWLLAFRDLRNLAKVADAPINVEQWKSAAYFVNFIDGYKLGEKVRAALKDPDRSPDVRRALARTRGLDFDAIDAGEPLAGDLGNARLARFAAETIDEGWWRLLWVPPSMPYLEPGGPYAELAGHGARMTKRLVFSSWVAAPTAIASLLSYEADRRAVGLAWDGLDREGRETDRRTRRGRLAYGLREGEPASMPTLSLFWPMPGLATLADPLGHRRAAGRSLSASELEERVASALAGHGGGGEAPSWRAAFGRRDSLPDSLAGGEEALGEVVRALSGRDDDGDAPLPGEGSGRGTVALTKHAELALVLRAGGAGGVGGAGVVGDATELAVIAAHSPANIAYRALSRVTAGTAVTPEGLWLAAARLAAAFRTMFTKPETTLLLNQLLPDLDYWRAVLRYCAWGNLQAAMDEYLHHVAANGYGALDDAELYRLAEDVAEAIALRPANYLVFDPADPERAQRLTAHFALRFGGRRQDEDAARLPVVRGAFNSPFRPFVLATTSVGQEGIDFHWWCHAVVHWNTPSSPIDFEQREGRVDRYGGHAVRRNIAQRHAEEALRCEEANPWEAAYRIAQRDAAPELGAFAPHWVYPGDAHIERHVSPIALSVDEVRLERIKRDVALYRLTFGQPRQEDMLALLRQKYGDVTAAGVEALRLDLRPPGR